MSEVARRMAIRAGAHCLEMYQGGRGALLGGVTGVPAADVLFLGGGVVCSNAAHIAIGSEARAAALGHRRVAGRIQISEAAETESQRRERRESHCHRRGRQWRWCWRR